MSKSVKTVVLIGTVILLAAFIFLKERGANISLPAASPAVAENPLSIAAMRENTYPGSDLIIQSTLTPGSNYNRYIASYQSDGLTIYGLLTIPTGNKPAGGWPAIIFNHGYIQPNEYKTEGPQYAAYVDALAKSGFVVFKPDYRGNGNSQGSPTSAYYAPDYAIDDLNALASVKKYKDVNPNDIGIWGHSMGGNITLRDLVIDPADIKAAVIWGGVVGTYNDLINNWQNRVSYHPAPTDLALRNHNRQNLISQYGTPQTNPEFWNSIDPTNFLSDISAPIQLHQGESDNEVPPDFSANLAQKLKEDGKTVEYYTYPGGDHNLSGQNFDIAMARTIAFFNKYLKGGE